MPTTANACALPGRTQTHSLPARKANRRLIDARTGRALEILGHAIEYLTDEYIHTAKELSAQAPEVEAIQLLMAINREMYFECPVTPTFRERLRTWFRFQRIRVEKCERVQQAPVVEDVGARRGQW